MERPPPVQYAVTDDGVHIANQVIGAGPVDIPIVGSWFGHVDGRWDTPDHAHLLRRLASFSRLIVFDKRGVGASDPARSRRRPRSGCRARTCTSGPERVPGHVRRAGPGDVLVSRTVKDLVAGSGLAFADAGTHALNGVPDEWQLHRLVP